ncbi:hypothetical protein DFP72DRAFT_355110 [Ephemerocybe angulata]|uniref:SH3 domain-containing protein n=1 Tax=Ephemerocybe angulata TaxID=980116 RepID=A0A8H6HZ29_9AGAR|nr:hypothetical protein DFP72DRAFT_355110 [Tulosesus angulatus]
MAGSDDLDPMGLTAHSKSPHPSQHDNTSTHQNLDDPRNSGPAPPLGAGSNTHLHLGSAPAHSKDALDGAGGQPPPIPHADGHGVGGVEVYEDEEPTTAERVQDNFVLVVSLVIAFLLWLVALVSQSYVAANVSTLPVRPTFFPLLLQLSLLLTTTLLLLTTYLPPYHIQLSTLASLTIVFAVLAADANIYSPSTAAQKACGGAWLATAVIDLLWVIYFTSPPQSPVVAWVHGPQPTMPQFFNATGAATVNWGGAKGVEVLPPSQRNTLLGAYTPGPNRLSQIGSGRGIELGPLQHRTSVARSASRPLSGIAESQRSGGAVLGRPNAPFAHEGGAGSALGGVSGGSGIGGGDVESGVGERKSGSRWSLYQRNREGAAAAARDRDRERERERERERDSGGQSAVGAGPSGEHSGSTGVGAESSRPESRKVVVCRAVAMYNYTAGSDDPSELTFRKGEALEILDRSGKWWEGRRADGTTGIVPSNYLRVVD